MKEKIVKYTQEELKNKKGSTHWAELVKQNKEANKKVQSTQKNRR